MTRRELGALVIRIAALFLWIGALKTGVAALASSVLAPLLFTQHLQGVSGHYFMFSWFSQLLTATAYGAAGLYLMRRSETFGAGLLRGRDPEERLATVVLADVQTAAFSVTGLFLVATAVPKLFGSGPLFITRFYGMGMGTAFNPMIAALLEIIVQVIIGLILFFKGGALSEFLIFLRGTKAAPIEPGAPEPGGIPQGRA